MSAGQVLLVTTLAAPAVGAAVAVPLARRDESTARVAGTVAAAVALLASALLYAPADGPWHAVRATWAPDLNLEFHIGVDGISYPLVVLTTLLTLLCCLYTLRHVPEGGRPLIRAA